MNADTNYIEQVTGLTGVVLCQEGRYGIPYIEATGDQSIVARVNKAIEYAYRRGLDENAAVAREFDPAEQQAKADAAGVVAAIDQQISDIQTILGLPSPFSAAQATQAIKQLAQGQRGILKVLKRLHEEVYR